MCFRAWPASNSNLINAHTSNLVAYDGCERDRAVKIVTEMGDEIESSTTKRMLLWQKSVTAHELEQFVAQTEK